MSSQNLQPVSSEYNNEISIYTGQLTDKCVVSNIVLIKKAFPSLPLGFYDVFMDMVRDNSFTDSRLNDAVKYVICNCQYPQPTIASFIAFDKKVKSYTYSQYCKLCESGDGGSYLPVSIKGNVKPVWIHVNDINEYGFTIHENYYKKAK